MDYLQYTDRVRKCRFYIGWGFKPYYKWITFNTSAKYKFEFAHPNLCFKPYYKWITFNTVCIRDKKEIEEKVSFKPYYKWITFNTINDVELEDGLQKVLNLIINGLPSIL